jgi:hypothetical protein
MGSSCGSQTTSSAAKKFLLCYNDSVQRHALPYSENELMSTQDQPEQQDHWAALAEQLGLPPPPKPESKQAPPPPAAAPPAERAETPAEPEPPAAQEPEPEPFEDRLFAGEAGFRHDRRRDFDSVEEHLGETAPAADLEEVPEPAAPPEPVAEEEKPAAPGQRRGRRSGRGRSAKGGRERGGEEAAGAEAEKPESGRRRGRGRGRTRGKQSKTQGPAGEKAGTEALAGQEAPGGQPDDKDDEMDNLSDWNVPSWTELIASLYRPER